MSFLSFSSEKELLDYINGPPWSPFDLDAQSELISVFCCSKKRVLSREGNRFRDNFT